MILENKKALVLLTFHNLLNSEKLSIFGECEAVESEKTGDVAVAARFFRANREQTAGRDSF